MEIDESLKKQFNSEMSDLTEALEYEKNAEEESLELPYIRVKKEKLYEAILYLKTSEKYQMDYLNSISGVHLYENSDEGGRSLGFDMVYHLSSMQNKKAVVVKCFTDEATHRVPSIDQIYKSANWFEREVYDLFGVDFENSRDLRRIMTPEDWVGHPLRKDYKEEAEYNGMSTSRENELEKVNIFNRINQ